MFPSASKRTASATKYSGISLLIAAVTSSVYVPAATTCEAYVFPSFIYSLFSG